LSGNYAVGSLIPTENELETKYEVSKITVRKAVEQLVSEGYLVKKSGIGTRVISNNLFNKLSKARSYSSIVNEQGNLSKKILQVKLIDASGTPLSKTFKNQDILYIKRLYSLNDKPFIIVNHYLPTLKAPDEIEELENQSLYTFLKNSGREISSF
jgi:Transcriptional regulators